jgi:pilus assembly protein Flp/PilA
VEKQGVIRRFVADESGATAIEYAIIVGIMSLVVVSIAATGGALDSVFERVSLVIDAIRAPDETP